MVIVLANGCFDLLHYGHIILLKGARQLGDRLIVAVNSDKSVRDLKGKNRPIIPQIQRVEMLKAIRYVDSVIMFDSEKELECIIRKTRPNILAKGPDWKGNKLTGQDFVESYGGRVEIIPLRVNATTAIIKRINNENACSR